ncbi:hypothetical protein EG68_01083 [Paragonimus skrjabini miyazakii]|uniref:ANK_REP_REGION domain-containing protein n=1 Tax=Paragonimus skrjabini miyazakii TaxID=59628 RepID=A0A8S9Z8T5_9TREM|nr:hypothetical protein EG68_01083 [Paragonimus skrjabini miyazakii]
MLNTPLHVACSSGQYGVVNGLCAVGTDRNALNKDHHTPLMCAVTKSSVQCVLALLNAGARTDLTDGVS